jgi:hypothetical protein
LRSSIEYGLNGRLTVDELTRLKKENKRLRALLKTAVDLLHKSKEILRPKELAKPKKKKRATKV